MVVVGKKVKVVPGTYLLIVRVFKFGSVFLSLAYMGAVIYRSCTLFYSTLLVVGKQLVSVTGVTNGPRQ